MSDRPTMPSNSNSAHTYGHNAKSVPTNYCAANSELIIGTVGRTKNIPFDQVCDTLVKQGRTRGMAEQLVQHAITVGDIVVQDNGTLRIR